MPVKTAATKERRHVTGDINKLFFTFTDIDNTDTFTVPGFTPSKVLSVLFIPTTAVAVGTSIAAGVVTFATAADNLAGTLVIEYV